MAEVTAAGERPASERLRPRLPGIGRTRRLDVIASFATAVGAVADSDHEQSSVPAVTCAFPASTSAISLTVTVVPRARPSP